VTRENYPDRGWQEPKLREFSIANCMELESVEGLKNAKIQVLQIMNCTKITSIDYLSQFSSLQCCDFTDCTELMSVESLANAPLMDRLILKKCNKVKPKPRFLVMDSLEKVQEYLSKFKKNNPKAEVSKDKKDINEKLKELLLSTDYTQINLGLDLANSLSDIEIFKHLLDGVQIINGQLIPNSIFLWNDKNKEFRTFALEGLLCVAPKEIEVAQLFTNSITEKVIHGTHITSLISVSGLDKLVSLTVDNTGIAILSDMSKLQMLEKLELTNNVNLKDLSGLQNLKKLKTIIIKNCGIGDLKNISDLHSLITVEINSCPQLLSAQGVANLPLLDKINLDSNHALENIDALGEITSLKQITMNSCPGIGQIKALTKLPALQILELDQHRLKNTDGMTELLKPILEGLRG
jgi:hypothetical protein